MQVRTVFCALIACAVVYACPAAQTRSEIALKHIEATIHAFTKAHHHQLYPKSLKELSAFAAARGQPLDLSPFAKITLQRSSSQSVRISYTTNGPVPESRTVSFVTVY
jgi:hypothetical protein